MPRGIDFDDADYGFKEEDKPSQKVRSSTPAPHRHADPLQKKNEKVLQDLVSKCNNAQFATIAEAIDELDEPRLKPVRPYKSYDGQLTLGDPDDPKHPTPMTINVERYFKTKLARPITASSVILSTGKDGSSQAQPAQDEDAMEGVESTADYAAVKHARTYKINDPDAPGGKKDVEFEELAKGYEYGRTAVHISESEWNITKLETTKSFTILGFIPAEKASDL